MKVHLRVTPPAPIKANAAAISAFSRFCDENGIVRAHSLSPIELDERGSQLADLLERMASHGMTLRPVGDRGVMSESERQRYLRFERHRVYEVADLESCEYLTTFPLRAVDYESAIRRDDDVVVITGRWDESLRSPENGTLGWFQLELPEWGWERAYFRSEKTNALIVSDDVRRALSAEALRGPEFAPVVFEPNVYAGKAVPTWWEIDSRIRLPPVSDTMLVVDPYEKPLTPGDNSRGAMMIRPRDGIHPAEVHYRRSAIESVGPFDLARMFEPHGTAIPRANGVVASQKYYRVLRDLGVRAHWVPVRIDEG